MSLDQNELVAASPTAGAAALSPASSAPAERLTARFSLERVAVLDILRGIALIGMFMVHFNYYEATPAGADPGRLASFIEQFTGMFIEERFWSIFAMLFGVGFAVQLTRAEARGEPFVGRYFRRLAALAVFGFIAEGVFGYNVLLGYALWGVPLFLVRKWPVKRLLLLLVLCASSRQIYSVGKMAWAARTPNGIVELKAANQARLRTFLASRDSVRKLEQSQSWGTVVAARVGFMPKFHWQWNRFPNADLMLFLLGLIGWKLGLFTRPEARKRLIVGLMIFGVASTALYYVFPLGGPPPQEPNPNWPLLSTIAAMFRTSGFGLVRPELLAFTYMGTVLLLVAHNRVWLQRLSFFGWAGRMALTNYMMQVILLDTMFTPHGFGLKIPAPLVWPGAIALFVAQVYMSRWWLARFRIGPLEWIWRSVTYWKVQPIRIQRIPATPRLVMEAVGD
jgi:uncharacterized protein